MTGNSLPPAIPTTIPALPQTLSVSTDALLVISQGGNTYRASVAQVLAATGGGAAPSDLEFLLLASSLLAPEARVFSYNNTQFQAVDNGAGLTYVLSLNFGTAATPVADAATADVGDSIVPARSNHAHPINVSGTNPLAPTGSASPGSAPYYARSDHQHGAPPAFTGATNVTPGTLGGVPIAAPGEQDYGLFGDGTWRPVPGGGTVQSVGLVMPSLFDVAGSPVTVTGDFTVTLAVQSANQVWAGPSTGAAAAPTFRTLVDNDIPGLDASKIDAGIFPLARGGTNASDAQGARLSILPAIAGQAGKALVVNGGETDYTLSTVAMGTVTSIGLTGTANEITVTGASPITTSGTWALSLPTALTFTGKTITGGAFTGGTWDNGIIGGGTPAAITSTTLTATGAVALSPADANVVISPTGTGIVTIAPATAGTLNNVAIGGVTPLAGTFTALTATRTSATPATFNISDTASTPTVQITNTSSASSVAKVASIRFRGTDTVSTVKTAVEFSATPADANYVGVDLVTSVRGSDTVTERMRIASTGVITLGAGVSSSSLRVTPTAASVNFLDVTGGASGTGPTISAQGSGTDLDLRLTPKGAGYVFVTATGIKFPDNTTQTTAATAGLTLAEVQAAVVSL